METDMFRTRSASSGMQNQSSDDLQREYDLITRERDGGHNALSAINAQNDIARELERRES
jgi:hypothetical protein